MPQVIEFDINDETHVAFVRSAARLYARLRGLDVHTDDIRNWQEEIAGVLGSETLVQKELEGNSAISFQQYVEHTTRKLRLGGGNFLLAAR